LKYPFAFEETKQAQPYHFLEIKPRQVC
jgi:hypothetical protein